MRRASTAPFRTSREIYDRIRWDPRFDPSRFVIGYEARLGAPKEVPFTAFVPDGDVPWHRVLHFREGATIVWDRRARVDLLSSPGARARTASAALAVMLPQERFDPLPIHRFDAARDAWIAALPGASIAAPSGPMRLRVATWNVLSDQHERERVRTPRRVPSIVASLEALDADVIALQEVTPAVHAALLGAPWVRAHYAISEGPRTHALDPEGDLFLLRGEVTQLGAMAFSRAKRAIAAVLRAGDASVVVAQVHLPSDFAADAARNRRAYLTSLLDALAAAGDAPIILLGDFNWDDEELDALVAHHRLSDAWASVNDVPAATFDPTRNALAEVMSRTGRPARIDRVFSRGLRPTAIDLFATDPLEAEDPPLFASDHFGLSAALVLGDDAVEYAPPHALEDAFGAPTHHTAVVIVPPAQIWPEIQAIRGAHDRHATRWMPHVTLVYPFVPEADLERARERLSEAVSETTSFDVTLDRLETFEHGNRLTVWARPSAAPEGALHALQAKIARAFPRCAAEQRGAEGGFNPHLTLAQVDVAEPEGAARLARWTRAWRPLRFTVSAVQVIHRRGETPFEVRHAIPLGGAELPADSLHRWLTSASPAATPALEGARDRVIAALRDACAYASADTASPAILHLVGSARLGLSGAEGDLDAVAVAPPALSRAAFFQAAEEWLAGAGAAVRQVHDAVAPVLRGELDGAPFDLGFGRLPDGSNEVDPCALSPGDLARTDAASAIALGAVRDADALDRALAGRVPRAAFASAVRALKRWARARGLCSNAFGYLSGFGWTLLAAWACAREGAPRAPSALLAQVFRACASAPERHAFALNEAAASYTPRARDALILPTPSAPARNVARNVLLCTSAVLRAELARGMDLSAQALSSGSWDALFAPYERPASASEILVDFSAGSPEALAAAVGWLEGAILGPLLDLDAAAIPGLRPDPRPRRLDASSLHVRFAVAFDASNGVPAHVQSAIGAALRGLHEAFEAWPQRPLDTRIDIDVAAVD